MQPSCSTVRNLLVSVICISSAEKLSGFAAQAQSSSAMQISKQGNRILLIFTDLTPIIRFLPPHHCNLHQTPRRQDAMPDRN